MSAPDLDSLRQQLGDAVFEARIAEARSRVEILTRLEAATASGVGFQGAVQSLGISTTPSTLRRWFQRWRSFGLAGLVDQQRGSPPDSVLATCDPAPAHAQLALAGMVDGHHRPPPAPRPSGRRGGVPSPLLKWPGSKMPFVAHLCEDFEACAGRVRSGDFVYLDPPYAAGLSDGETFKYQAGGFGEAEQRRVAELFRLLDQRGSRVMASNADCQLTRRIYAGFEIDALSVRRRIGGRQERRGRAAEIVVRNYTGRRGVLPGV